jgi:hypothetical protein
VAMARGLSLLTADSLLTTTAVSNDHAQMIRIDVDVQPQTELR